MSKLITYLEKILEGVWNSACDECLPACTDIRYNSATTSLRIWKQRMLELIEQNIDKYQNPKNLQYTNTLIINIKYYRENTKLRKHFILYVF